MPDTTPPDATPPGTDPKSPSTNAGDFSQQANQPSTSLFKEYLDFLRSSKKWWLTPIIVFLLLLGIIVVLGSTGVAPFIYTLF